MTPILPFRRTSPMFQVFVILVSLSSLIAEAAVAQPDACIEGVQPTVTTTAWQEIRLYFASLVESPEQRNKALLIRLRSRIVELESEKQRLLDIIEAHARGEASGQGISQDLALNKIPNILEQIRQISATLKDMAQSANLFAAEPAFRKLVFSLDAKRTTILCAISKEAATGLVNTEAVKRLTVKLRSELEAIIAAEDALAAYIRKLE